MLALRLPVASGWGVVLSLVTFWALWSMISVPIDIGDRVVATSIEFTRQIVDSEAAPKARDEKPELQIPPTPPQHGKMGVPDEKVRPRLVRHQPPLTITGGERVEIETQRGGGTDQDVQPIVRFDPDYPLPALRGGTEGWVRVQFSVSKTGRVTDVFVVDADPRGVFEKESIEAVRRWLYSPKIEDGVAVERLGLQTLFRFEMPE